MKEIISSWANLLRALILIAFIIGGIYIIVEKVIGHRNFNLSVAGSEIRIGENGSLKSHLVAPIGWVDSDISVSKGDAITLRATGRVNVSMSRMLPSLIYFHKTFKNKKDGNIELFTDEEIDSSTFIFPWNRASGIELSEIENHDVFRRIQTATHKLLYPHGKVGQLLVYNYTDHGIPTMKQLTEDSEVYKFEGEEIVIDIKNDGRLYFSINDVVLENEKRNELIWQDNLGMLAITTVTKKSDN